MIIDRTILAISPFIHRPLLHGAITRIYHLNKELAADNRLVVVHREEPAGVAPEFARVAIANPATRIGQIFSPSLMAKVKKVASTDPPELILAHHLWAGVHGLLLSRSLKIPFIFDNHNVEFIRFQKTKSRLWIGIWLMEKWICQRADTVQSVSEVDRGRLISAFRLPADRVHVVENGVDVNEYAGYQIDTAAFRTDLGIAPEEQFILFYGSLTYPPNLEAVQILIDEIAPRLARLGIRAQIFIVGHGELPIHDLGVSETVKIRRLGYVEDLLGYIKSADVVAVPLLAGSGTRFKILESIASHCPVVSTTIGAEGIDREACQPFLTICDDWDEFAVALATATKPSARGLTHAFLETYDWPKIVGRMQFPHPKSR